MIFYCFVVEGKSLQNGRLGISGICYFSLKDNTSVTKNPHCAGARTVPALYGCGPHSNLIFKGHWTLIFKKKIEKKNLFLLFYSQFSK